MIFQIDTLHTSDIQLFAIFSLSVYSVFIAVLDIQANRLTNYMGQAIDQWYEQSVNVI